MLPDEAEELSLFLMRRGDVASVRRLSFSDKGQNEGPAEAGWGLGLIRGKPDGHAVMSLRRLRRIGPEQPVPYREIEAIIRIVLAEAHRVMHAVHVGRDDEKAQGAIEPR